MAQAQKKKPTTANGWIQLGNRTNKQIQNMKRPYKNKDIPIPPEIRKKIFPLRVKRYNAYLQGVKMGASLESVRVKDARKKIANTLGAPKKVKKESSEFTKPVGTKPGEAEETMTFTTVEVFGKKEAARLAKADKRRERSLAKKESNSTLQKKGRSSEYHQEIMSWLMMDPEYARLVNKVQFKDQRIKQASEALRLFGKRMYLNIEDKEGVGQLLDSVSSERRVTVEFEKERIALLKNLEPHFGEEFPEARAAYNRFVRAEEQALMRKQRQTQPFHEIKMARRIDYEEIKLKPGSLPKNLARYEMPDSDLRDVLAAARGPGKKIREMQLAQIAIETETKERIYRTVVKNMPPPKKRSANEKRFLRKFREAANNDLIELEQFLQMAGIDTGTAGAVTLAFAEEAVRKVGIPTRTITEEGRMVVARAKLPRRKKKLLPGKREEVKPTVVARATTKRPRKGKKPVKLARLAKPKKGKKKV